MYKFEKSGIKERNREERVEDAVIISQTPYTFIYNCEPCHIYNDLIVNSVHFLPHFSKEIYYNEKKK